MLSTKRRPVFISGSAYEYGRFGDLGKPFVKDLTSSLLQNNFSIISGFGLGIGSFVVESVMNEVYLSKKEPICDHLQVYPFPPSARQEDIKECYRNEMISKAEVAIFIFGNKLEDISIREAHGMFREFEIARSHKVMVIPVGASGYVAERLWLKVLLQYDEYFDSREKFDLYEQLGTPYTRPERLIELIIKIAQ